MSKSNRGTVQTHFEGKDPRERDSVHELLVDLVVRLVIAGAALDRANIGVRAGRGLIGSTRRQVGPRARRGRTYKASTAERIE